MTITVEDGSIVEDANSYATETELSDYATARGVTLSGDTEQLLIQAMDYIEAQSFKGAKYTQDQELQWPRSGVKIDGFSIGTDEIPKDLKKAQMAVAVAIDEGNSPDAVITSGIKMEKVDVIEIEYQDNAITNSIDPKINNLLKKLTAASSAFNPKVYRG